MGDPIELQANDLAAMLCSKICHDLINPVGAINNGLQALEDPGQAEMADLARQMVSNASKQALAKLEYARLAYGASSTAGTEFDTRECEKVARILFDIEKADLDWGITPVFLPKNKAKLMMNMLLIAISAVPRGGRITVNLVGEAGREAIEIVATSDPEQKQRTFLPQGVQELLAGTPEGGVEARNIQPFYTGLLARMSGMSVSAAIDGERFDITAVPAG
ncbi:MAG: histidine phosphotransferase [Alphaproteobacteria bacterium]|nr:histidine phosphotransferase [Alphaproteobacteria bacterium]